MKRHPISTAKTAGLGAALLLLGGCASMSESEVRSVVQQEMGEVEATSEEALEKAEEALSKAEKALAQSQKAQQDAQKAMESAESAKGRAEAASQKADRMFDRGMRKQP